MAEVLFRITSLFSRRPIVGWWLVLACGGAALTGLPLLGQPGYELAAGLTLLLAFGGSGLALAAARVPDPHLAATSALLILATVPALLISVARTALATPCDAFLNIGFVPLLIVPTAVLVASSGALAVRISRRWWLSFTVYFGAVIATAVLTLWPIINGPQVFAFNHFAGYLPGPLYDEDLSVPPSLWWFRLATLCLGLGIWAMLQRKRAWAAVLLFGFVGLESVGTRLGFRMTDEALAQTLGGVHETPELVLHYPLGISHKELDRMLGDLRFRHHQLVDFFGAKPTGQVKVWLYRSAEEKQRLVGAANTQFAKPWRREIHVNAAPFPHPVIKHELVHALAAPWGTQPFGVTATFAGLLPHIGVIEGLAVAADNPIDDLSLHEWAAAMKKRRLLPPVAKLMTARGFYGEAPNRAYNTAGSFLRFLSERFGKDALRRLYRDGDFEQSFGQPLETLAHSYEAFLDDVPLEPQAVNQAFARFNRGSVFERPCAREVSLLSGEARAISTTEPARALKLLSRCRTIQPTEPSHALAEALVLKRLGRLDAALALLESEMSRLETEPAPWAEAALARADLAFEGGDQALAAQLWGQIIERKVSPTMERTATVRLDGGDAVAGWFAAGDEELKLYSLMKAPQRLSVRYLLGRRLQQMGASVDALPLLSDLLEEALPPSLAKETTRLGIEAAFSLGRCDLVRRWGLTQAFGPAFATRGADWVERCTFEHP